MSRFLFFIPPFYGHINPALNVVKDLTDRDQEVVFYTGPLYREVVEAAGAKFRAVPESGDRSSDFLEETGIEMIFQFLQATVDSARDERPDCVVYDPMCLEWLLLARIVGAPAARLHLQLPINEKYHPYDTFAPSVPVRPQFDAFDHDMQKLCDFYRIPAIGYHEAVFHAESLNIVPFPKSFVPAVENFDERFHFVGPLFDASSEGDDLAPSQPLLYVAMGTEHSNIPAFYDICITAFRNQSRRVVISTGNEVDHSLFGSIPAQVSLHHRVQQMEVLRQAGAFINHGGLNSIMEALYYGVPMVAVPIILEEKIVAKRMTELQLGLVVEPQMVTSHTLRDATARIEESQEIRSAVDRMQKLIRESGGTGKPPIC